MTRVGRFCGFWARRPFLSGLGAATFVACTAGAGFVLYQSTVSSRSASQPVAKFSVPEESLQVGTVWEDERFQTSIPVTNNEPFSVDVASFSASCDCLSIEPASFRIDPAETRKLSLCVDLTSQAAISEKFSVRFTPLLAHGPSGGPTRGPQWSLTGTVRRALLFQQKTYYLGRHSELAQPMPQLVIPVQAAVDLKALSVESDHPSISTEVGPNTAGNYTVTIRWLSELPVGPFNATVTLRPIHSTGDPLPVRRLLVQGTIVPDIETAPPTIAAGGRRIGETFEESVTIRSITGRALTDIQSKAEGAGLTVSELGGPSAYLVRQHVLGQGTVTNQVRFSAKTGGKPVSFCLPVNFTGVEP